MNYWIFQANPDKYKIIDSLQSQGSELFTTRQFADQIKTGDRVAIWVSGNRRGVYALAVVTENPQLQQDNPESAPFWISRDDADRVEMRCRLTYVADAYGEESSPILYSQHMNEREEGFTDLPVIRQPQGTNYSLSRVQWVRICELADEHKFRHV